MVMATAPISVYSITSLSPVGAIEGIGVMDVGWPVGITTVGEILTITVGVGEITVSVGVG